MTTLYIDKDKLYALAEQLYEDVPPKDNTQFAAYKNGLFGLLFDIGIEQHTLLVQPTETAAICRDMWVWHDEAGELHTDNTSVMLNLTQLDVLGMLTPPPPPEPEPEPEAETESGDETAQDSAEPVTDPQPEAGTEEAAPETETPENAEAVDDGTEAEG